MKADLTNIKNIGDGGLTCRSEGTTRGGEEKAEDLHKGQIERGKEGGGESGTERELAWFFTPWLW